MLGAATAAWAQDTTPPEKTLQEIQVVDQADDGAATVIARDTLQRHQAADMADVFANEASVSVGGAAANAQRIYLRGVDGGNLNISIDGARQGRPLHQHRGNAGGLDPDLLKRVEIQPGQGADAGPGALGGSIRFETVDAQDLAAPGRRNLGAIVRAAWLGADDTLRGGSTAYLLAGAHVGLLAHASAANRDDYRVGGGGRVPNSGGQDRDYLVKLSVLDLAGHSVRAGVAHDHDTGLYVFSRVGSDNGYTPDGAVATRQRADRTTYTLEHRYRRPDDPLVDTRLNLYVNEQRLDELTATPRGAATREKGGSLRNTAQFTFAGARHRLVAGTDFFDEEGVTTGVMGVPQLGAGRKSTGSRNLGLFVQDRAQWRRLMVALGVRHDRYDTQYGPRALEGGATSPNANAEVDLGGGFALTAGYGEAVRASGALTIGFQTSIDERTNFNDGKPLRPESSRMRDAGVNYAGHDVLVAGARATARVARFDTRIDDLVEWAGQGAAYPTYIRNMREQFRSRGWEVKAGWSAGDIDTTLGLLLADTTVGGKPINPLRRVGAAVGDRLAWDIRWQAAPDLVAGYTLNAARRLDDVPAGAVERPGYAIHEVQLEWQPAAVHGLRVALAVRNLGDKRYVSHSSLDGGTGNILPEPGRDVRATLAWQF